MKLNLQITITIIFSTIKSNLDYLNSEEFILFLQSITSIKEKLIPDKNLNGGGLS